MNEDRARIGLLGTGCVVCVLVGLWWVLSHIGPRYELKLAGESGENPDQMVVCESSWWGLKQHCFPIRYSKGWEVYRDGEWHTAALSGIEDEITVQDEIAGTQWPP